MPDDAIRILLPPFQFLVDRHGFHVVASETSTSFDDCFVELANDALNVRIPRDRGVVDAEVSPHFAPDQWVPVAHIAQLVLSRDRARDETLKQQASLLRDHYAEVMAMFSPANLDMIIGRVRNVSRETFNRLFPGSVSDGGMFTAEESD